MRLKREHIIMLMLTLTFASEIGHGILTHQLGTDEYGPVSVGEVVRGGILVLLLIHVLTHLRRPTSRMVLIAFGMIVLLVLLQALFFKLNVVEIIQTVLYGLRWLYVWFVMEFVSWQVVKAQIPLERLVTRIKVLIVLFYSIPIFLAAFGIVGYTTYDIGNVRQGYVGLVMNNNVVASVFVLLLPFFLQCRSLRDVTLLAAFAAGALLLGSKLVYAAFAVTLGIWAVSKVAGWLFKMKLAVRWHVKRFRLVAVILALMLVTLMPFTPYAQRIIGIVNGLADSFAWQAATRANSPTGVIDTLTSDRTYGIYRLTEWLQQEATPLAIMIGRGQLGYRQLYAELDWIDLMGWGGIVGVVGFASILLYWLWRLFRTRQRPFGRETLAMLMLSAGCSLVAGHTYDNSMVGIVVGTILGCFLAVDLQRNRFENYARL